jgi:hypothetical protein
MVGYMYKGFDHFVDLSATRKDMLYGADQWPLEYPPSHYWQQGGRFSDLLASMLRLRKVMPAFRVKNGKIGVDNEVKAVKEWFEAIDLSVDALRQAMDKPYGEIDESAWEFRWVGRLFEA